MLNIDAIIKKTIIFVGILGGLLSLSNLYGQSSIKENPYYHMLATKSMGLTNGKIDFVERKKVKGQKKPIETRYTLIFSKDVSYKSKHQKTNIHLLNERDSILYLVNDDFSYIIDYKKKEVITESKNSIISMLRKNHPFAYFYSNLAGGGLLLMGTYKDMTSTDFSTKVSFAEQKIFTDIFTISQRDKEKQTNSKIFCVDEYEFRNKDTLLINHTSNLENPSLYEKGTTVGIETIILHAILNNQEYQNPHYYNYTHYCADNFHFYDNRNSSITNSEHDNINNYSLSGSTSEDRLYDIYSSSDFIGLENEMISLYLQVKEEQLKQQTKEKDSDVPTTNNEIVINDAILTEIENVTIVLETLNRDSTIKNAAIEEDVSVLKPAIKSTNTTSHFTENNSMENIIVSIIPPVEMQDEVIVVETPVENIIIEDVIVNIVLPETSEGVTILLSSNEESLPTEIDLLFAETEEKTLENETTYFIVLGCFMGLNNAEVFLAEGKEHHTNLLHLGMTPSGLYMVGIGPYKTEDEVKMLLENGTKGWILKQQLYLY